MASVARYSYINAKIRGRKADLLSPEQIDALLGARSMLAALRILDATGYAELVRGFDASTTPIEVERALQEDFGRVLIGLLNDIPKSRLALMTSIARKFQREIAKTLLRVVETRAGKAVAERLLVPLPPFTLELCLELAESPDIPSLIRRIPEHNLRRILEKALPRYQENQQLALLEQALDSEVLGGLYKQVQRIGGLDEQRTLPLVGLEVDLVNLMVVLRSRLHNIPPEEAEELLLGVEYRLPLSLLREAIRARDLEGSIQLLERESRYGKLVAEAWDSYQMHPSLYAFERTFNRHILTESKNAMLGYPFHFGVILGYLNLKWYETLNLKAIMHGKAEGLDPTIIRRTLVI